MRGTGEKGLGLLDECACGDLLGLEPSRKSRNGLRKREVCGVDGGENFVEQMVSRGDKVWRGSEVYDFAALLLLPIENGCWWALAEIVPVDC